MRSLLYQLYDVFFQKKLSKKLHAEMNNYFFYGKEYFDKRQQVMDYAKKKCSFYNNYDSNFEKVKTISKNDLKNSISSFISTDYKIDELYKGRTSGSTASPMVFFLSKRKKALRVSELSFFNEWAGYKIGMRHALNSIGASKSKLKLWIQNEVLLDPSKINNNKLDVFLDTITKKRIEFYIGYPSVLNQLAMYAKFKQLKISFKGIISTGEPLTEHFRQTISSQFDCDVLSRYSSLELGVIAHECEYHTLHVNGANLFVEVLGIDSDEPIKNGEIGRIIVTDYNNYAMPLIRYDTGDLGSIEQSSCKCGRKGNVIRKLQGRKVDFIIDADGNKFSFAFLNTLIWPYHDKISHYQFLQNEAHIIKLFLQLSSSDATFTENLKFDIISNLSQNTIFDVETVEEIPPMASGKKPFVINNYLKSL
jgi:phenylacetate-CoA ligase